MAEAHACTYDRRMEKLPKRNISLSSYLQSYKYFRHVENQLRLHFTFRPDILRGARKWLDEQIPANWSGMTFYRVAIHVRRTDLVAPKRKSLSWPLPTRGYFLRSMAYFTDRFERVQFVVLSDDPAWCRGNVVGSNVIYSSGHTPIADMAIASLCDHAIITIGSYGWWVAWFANGVTVTQKEIPVKGSKLATIMKRDDYFKPEWIRL